jgi:hypothetical protein
VIYNQTQVYYNSTGNTCGLQKALPEGVSCKYNSDCVSNTNSGLICDYLKNKCSRGYNSLCLQNSDCATGFTCYSGLCQCVNNLCY